MNMAGLCCLQGGQPSWEERALNGSRREHQGPQRGTHRALWVLAPEAWERVGRESWTVIG